MAQYCRQALAPAFAKDVDYLFDITKKGFAFYAKTWGVPYPYAKFDQIYVPEYNAGAMENIGMVTIRDQYVFESKVTDALAERRVVTVLHELAHMWFGDYVTMKWWNDLWLNESFAEFTSTLATAEATEWKDAWATFSSGEKSWALNQDQLSTTHPIVAPINDLNDTYVNFDGITYAKGASVLKQLVYYVGREKFFKGINNYLNKHAYSNATLADLLAELELTSGRDLKAWSAQWLEESGINTIATEVEENEDGTIKRLALRGEDQSRLIKRIPAEHAAHRIGNEFPDDILGEFLVARFRRIFGYANATYASTTHVPTAHRTAHHHVRHTHPPPARYYGSHAGAVPRIRDSSTREDALSHLRVKSPACEPLIRVKQRKPLKNPHDVSKRNPQSSFEDPIIE